MAHDMGKEVQVDATVMTSSAHSVTTGLNRGLLRITCQCIALNRLKNQIIMSRLEHGSDHGPWP